ncbi:MAG: hypothetical protein JNK69_10720 [Saprospiraceae bacterium]|nr:hypothetical protein [Candidatus Vicinibacter proximus]MBL7823872.1 hypothetical protein [Saprospiraceae bacterium]MCC6841965.1 hypothetical protein [Saprospiraceae bacterium]HRG32658.1 hypothetical protein [Saprospiraceae bacterium]
MGFFDRILGGSQLKGPNLCFGRATDLPKDKSQLELWDKANESFNQGDYFQSLEQFFNYLNNPELQNLTYRKVSGGFEFSLVQGSKIIEGLVDNNWLRAESKLAKCKSLSIGFLRKLVESNFDLQYGRYALDPNSNLCIIFESFVEEASPYKLFFGLKEIAVKADKQDDLLLDEFTELEAINTTHIVQQDVEIKKVKFNFLKETLRKAIAMEDMGNLNLDRYPGAMTYIYLHTLYKIDYLLCPEGKSMELIEEAHSAYFEQGDLDAHEKVQSLSKSLKELNAIGEDKFALELYIVNHTFGINNNVPHSTIAQFIDTEMQALEWYLSNKHVKICQDICSYIVGYCLFSFALAEPVSKLFHLFYEIEEPDFFKDLGYTKHFGPKDIEIKKIESKIKSSIKDILQASATKYPEINSEVKLNFDSRIEFSISLLQLIKDLNV